MSNSEPTGEAPDLPEDCRLLKDFVPEAQARCELHYTFAHRFLPEFVHGDPLGFFAALEGEKSRGGGVPTEGPTRFIQGRWAILEMEFGLVPGPSSTEQLEQAAFRRVLDLEAWTETVYGKRGLFVQMPAPGQSPHVVTAGALAYFLGVVLVEDSSARVFTLDTLERTILDANATEWPSGPGALCEWTKENMHRNYEMLVEPRRKSFVTAIEHLLNAENPQDPG